MFDRSEIDQDDLARLETVLLPPIRQHVYGPVVAVADASGWGRDATSIHMQDSSEDVDVVDVDVVIAPHPWRVGDTAAVEASEPEPADVLDLPRDPHRRPLLIVRE